ncbi:MAG: hypothetical protein DRO23_01830 [Thermoprotei archaeon]|nr:MAG: hypothetical protein DRO23_01830 [Thermoprotei archaeon]
MKLRLRIGISNLVSSILFLVLLLSILAFFVPIASAQGKLLDMGKRVVELETLRSHERLEAMVHHVNDTAYLSIINMGGAKSFIDVLYLRSKENTVSIKKVNMELSPREEATVEIPELKHLNNYTKALIITSYGNVFYIIDPENSNSLNNSVYLNNSSSEQPLPPYNISAINTLQTLGVNLWSGKMASTKIWYRNNDGETVVFVNETNSKYYVTWHEPADTSYWENLTMNSNSFSVYEHLYVNAGLDGNQDHWYAYIIELPNSENAGEIIVNITVAYYVKAKTASDIAKHELYLALITKDQLQSIAITDDPPTYEYNIPMESNNLEIMYVTKTLTVRIPSWSTLTKYNVENYVINIEASPKTATTKYLAIIIYNTFITNAISSSKSRWATFSIAIQVNQITVR